MTSKKIWTSSDDTALTQFVAEGLSSRAIGEKLERSTPAVQTRRHLLNLKKGGQKQEVELAPDGLVLMTLETGIQPPVGRVRNEQLRNQLRKLFSNMKVGQSFVVPRKAVHIGHYLLSIEFESYRIRTSAVSPDRQFFRIFRIA